ncbi:MAG: chorismate mutase [Geminicoccaceae bacterium]
MSEPSPLDEFRKSIDNLDATLIYVLAERFRLTKRVGKYKRDQGLPSSDKGREREQIARLKSLAANADLDPEFAERILRFVIDEVIRHHEQIKNEVG